VDHVQQPELERLAAPFPGDALSLGIDVGTQGVRAALLDAEGLLLGTGSHPLRSGRRDGVRHEQDPREWWDAVCRATKQALAGRGHRPLAAVALDATSGTILVQDPGLQPLTAGLMYNDGRAAAQAERAIAAGSHVWARFGVRMQPSWALPRAIWLLEQGLVPAGARIVHQGDHLVSQLTGEQTATDSSQALKTGVDLTTLRWPVDVFDSLGLDVALLPEVVLPGTVIGQVSPAAAAATSIPAGTPVKAGMTDGCASQIACGAVLPGRWSSALGTTLVLKGSTTAPIIDPTGAVYSHRNPDGGWLPGGASSVGAGIIARDFPGADLDALTVAAADWEPAGGICYPLAGPGERFPFVAPAATGFSAGVPDNDAARFAAVLQGIAFTERLAFHRLRELGADVVGPISFVGGAAGNEYWNQLRCDLLGVEVVRPQSADAAVGMAILAASPAGAVGRTAEKMVQPSRSYQPDHTRAARFDAAYQEFVGALRDRGWLQTAPQQALR
jgi:sugar (pentulose or hexulose) kinase